MPDSRSNWPCPRHASRNPPPDLSVHPRQATGKGVLRRLARGRAPREPREAAYKVDARWADEAQRAELKWPTLRGTCRIEEAVVDPIVEFG